MTPPRIDRAFVRLESGLVHYRHVQPPAAGGGAPLLMTHGGPGSSQGLAPLILALGVDRQVIAPDMMGNGESDPPPVRPTTIAFYADCLAAVMDRLALSAVDLYGHHTGAQVACELAIARPDRVRRVILDGLGLYAEEQRVEYVARYAPEIVPDADGRAFQWVWEFASQITQHFPYYRKDQAHRIPGGAASPPAVVMQRATDLLKGWSTYHLAYEAAFRHPLAQRLPLLSCPTWVLEVERDPLARYAAEAAALIPGAKRVQTDYARRAQTIRDCLT